MQYKKQQEMIRVLRMNQEKFKIEAMNQNILDLEYKFF